jgi:hypothetical protein
VVESDGVFKVPGLLTVFLWSSLTGHLQAPTVAQGGSRLLAARGPLYCGMLAFGSGHSERCVLAPFAMCPLRAPTCPAFLLVYLRALVRR